MRCAVRRGQPRALRPSSFGGCEYDYEYDYELTIGVGLRYAASRGTAASAVLKGGAKDLRFTIYDYEYSNCNCRVWVERTLLTLLNSFQHS